MKKNVKKTKQQGLNHIVSAAIFVIAVALTALTSWALIKTDVNSDFEATFIGARDVEATINGASYIMHNAVVQKIEDLSEVKFIESSRQSSETAGFTKSITVVDDEDYIYYEFSITNDSTKTAYSDLIVKPVLDLVVENENDVNEIASLLYFSADKQVYTGFADEYITIEKGDTVYLKLKEELLGRLDAKLTGNVKFELYTQKSAPSDYCADYEYSIIAEEAYRTTIYTDGTKSAAPEKMQEYEYVIATPSTAQAILDSNINGKTIVFDAGVYGDLIIRPTIETVEGIYAYNESKPTIKGEEVALENVDKTKSTKGYHYVRTIKNVTFAGTNGAVFKGVFDIESANVGGPEVSTNSIANHTDKTNVGLSEARRDVIRDLELVTKVSSSRVTDISYYAHIPVDGMTFERMNFDGKYGRIYFFEGKVDDQQKNITIKNCSFETNEAYYGEIEFYSLDAPAVALYTLSSGFFDDVMFKNNYVTGHFQGFSVLNGNNVSIISNTIENVEGNAIALHGASLFTNGTTGTYTTGNIVVRDNTIKGTGYKLPDGERAIRFNVCKDARIEIVGNTFVEAVEDRTQKGEGEQVLKTGTLTNTSYLVTNNSFIYEVADVFLESYIVMLGDMVGKNGTLTIYFERPVQQ